MTASRREGRQRLVDAAVQLFADQGYEGTSIAAVADRSGVSRGSVPWHFGNKAGLLTAVVDQEIDRFLEAFSRRPTSDPEAAVQALTEFVQQPNTGLFVTLLSESMRPGSTVRDLHADLHRRILEAATEWLERVAPSTDDVRHQRATLALATVIGVQQQWRVAPERIDVPGTFRLLLSALLPQAAQARPEQP